MPLLSPSGPIAEAPRAERADRGRQGRIGRHTRSASKFVKKHGPCSDHILYACLWQNACAGEAMVRTVIIICPNLRCRALLQVPESVRGKKVRCGHCGTHFIIPSKEESVAAAGLAKPAGPPAR